MRKKPRQNEMSPIYLTVDALGKYKYPPKIKTEYERIIKEEN